MKEKGTEKELCLPAPEIWSRQKPCAAKRKNEIFPNALFASFSHEKKKRMKKEEPP
ncbi:hypothetical protein [Colidextribacter sp. OB.20]|uniref:hypothetical protein n=1 Tax=Colidextribacter sp. OB.20 TaxID=2304568 RepID=UPI00136B4479|nr:hypothetical protein [Colidextribacter sp. OB.20]